MKYIVITGSTNVWIKYTNVLHSFVAYGIKRVAEVFNSIRKYFENVGVSVRISSFVEISHEYENVAWLIGIYRANTIASSVFFVGNTRGPILDTTYQERNS